MSLSRVGSGVATGACAAERPMMPSSASMSVARSSVMARAYDPTGPAVTGGRAFVLLRGDSAMASPTGTAPTGTMTTSCRRAAV